MPSETTRPPFMTEPKPVDCVFFEGFVLEVREDMIRAVGFVDLEVVQEASPPERRIVFRAAMTTLVARSLIVELRRAVARGGDGH
jgi:hypothetical protein